jgi:hypothetical protein
MKRILTALRVPTDPVVAVHDNRSGAERSVHILGSAGFHSRMLTVVSRQSPLRPSTVASGAGRGSPWLCSGLFWGLCFAALTMAVTLALPASVLTPAILLLIVGLALALQVWIVRMAVAPEPAASASWHSSSPICHGYEGALAADKLLLVVDGSRSEIALARSLLQAC